MDEEQVVWLTESELRTVSVGAFKVGWITAGRREEAPESIAQDNATLTLRFFERRRAAARPDTGGE